MIHKLYKCSDRYKNLKKIARKRYGTTEFNHIYDLFWGAFFPFGIPIKGFFYYHAVTNQVLKKD